ncbi:helix-turn-helix transcriptional regulator [bacterium]|nr:helix-turn-helix transcriptional regulator [bacterium]
MILFNCSTSITDMQYHNKNNQILFGNKIKNLREQQEKSLNKFVNQRGGLTTATWSRIENGLVNLKLSTLILVASMLKIPLWQLLKDIDFDYEIEE